MHNSRILTLGADGVDAQVHGRPCRALVDGAGLAPGDAVTLGIRPEHVLVGNGPWSGRVTHIEALGEHSYLHLVTAEGAALQAKTQREDVRVGQTLAYALPSAALHVFNAAGEAQRRHRRAGAAADDLDAAVPGAA